MTRAPSRLTCGVLGFAMGLGTLGAAQVVSSVNTNGVLRGYIVQKDGREVCRNPSVFIKFKGPQSYIVCD